MIDGSGIPCELALRWMSLDLTDDKSTLVQVMAWCRQATSHYLSRCWLRPVSPYGVTRPQWVKNLYTKYVYIYIYIYIYIHTHTSVAPVWVNSRYEANCKLPQTTKSTTPLIPITNEHNQEIIFIIHIWALVMSRFDLKSLPCGSEQSKLNNKYVTQHFR